jgi:hypothetical protein
MGVDYYNCAGECGEIVNDAGDAVYLVFKRNDKQAQSGYFCKSCAEDVQSNNFPQLEHVNMEMTYKWKRPTVCDLTKITHLPECVLTLIIDYFAHEIETIPLHSLNEVTIKDVLHNLWRSWSAKFSQSGPEFTESEDEEADTDTFISPKELWSYLPNLCNEFIDSVDTWFEPLPWKPKNKKHVLERSIHELEVQLVKKRKELAKLRMSDEEEINSSFLQWHSTSSSLIE